MQFGLHVSLVACPLVVLHRSHVECVGVGVDVDALELSEDDAANHLAQLFVLVGILDVWPHLRTAVAEPHGMYVACIYKGVVLAVEVGCGVDGIRETVLEHPCQIGVALEEFLHFLYLLLYGIRYEEAFVHGWTLAHELGVVGGDSDGCQTAERACETAAC